MGAKRIPASAKAPPLERVPAVSEAKPEPSVKAKPDPAPASAERGRMLFHIYELWMGLVDPRWGPGVWGALRTAILTALSCEGETRSCCLVCRQDWQADPGMFPDGVLTTEPIKGDAPGSVSLICAICWDGTWNDNLRAAISHEFGMRPGDLRPIHGGGRA